MDDDKGNSFSNGPDKHLLFEADKFLWQEMTVTRWDNP